MEWLHRSDTEPVWAANVGESGTSRMPLRGRCGRLKRNRDQGRPNGFDVVRDLLKRFKFCTAGDGKDSPRTGLAEFLGHFNFHEASLGSQVLKSGGKYSRDRGR